MKLDTLPAERLEKMLKAGHAVREAHRILNKTGDNIVGEVLRGQGTFYQMNHYPEGDVYDHETHSQYYYHAHRDGEHGHFHTFLRPKGMPDGIAPAKVADLQKPESENDMLSHLVAISMDSFGFVQGLFTTNRWVTAEYWYDAEDVIRMLDQFDIDHAQPSWPVNVWIGNIIQLFYPQICELIRARDKVIADRLENNPAHNIFEDRSLEITSEIYVNADDQIAAVEKALGQV